MTSEDRLKTILENINCPVSVPFHSLHTLLKNTVFIGVFHVFIRSIYVKYGWMTVNT